jgi:hypothetical protein
LEAEHCRQVRMNELTNGCIPTRVNQKDIESFSARLKRVIAGLESQVKLLLGGRWWILIVGHGQDLRESGYAPWAGEGSVIPLLADACFISDMASWTASTFSATCLATSA